MLEKKLNSLNVLQLNLKHGDIASKYMRFSLFSPQKTFPGGDVCGSAGKRH